ncbi:MAG: 2-oxo acid dehydrogenase subunit E2 [Anaerolineales bacterium]|nr:2-oxo acid dehydrogenase subunit E2 [Chloroflexota bacterium]MBL6979926.1 2-oxo acid dehydrogenase subunit E2 [Anaerolineales bacterium]
MPTKVTVPLLGEGIEEVTVVNWLKVEGDSVEEYDGLVEVETDKVVTEVVCPASGILLKIETPNEGDLVRVGEILAWIGQPGEEISDDTTHPEAEALAGADVPILSEDEGEKDTPKSAPTPEPSPAPALSKVEGSPPSGRDSSLGFISPVVARIASEHTINLNQISGTGRDGRITKNDVLAYIESRSTPMPPNSPAPALPGSIIPHTITRKRIAEHMLMSKRNSPHVTTVMEADLSSIVAHRKANKGAFAQDGTRLTFTAYFVSATAQALKAFPLVNSSWTDEGVLLHQEINIGMATDLGEEGLIVPVIKSADELSLLGISRAVNDLAKRARTKKLAATDVKDGTFSITNHGVSGSLFAAPIINQPQCAILGVGAIKKRVVVITDEVGNDAMAIRPMVYLSLTFDHRILDGAGADHFLVKVVESLENWK